MNNFSFVSRLARYQHLCIYSLKYHCLSSSTSSSSFELTVCQSLFSSILNATFKQYAFIVVGPVSDLSVMGGVIFIIVSKTLLQCMEYETSFTSVPNAPPKVVQVACGEHHVLVLTESQEVFSRGTGPQCGLGAENANVQVFTKIPGLSDIYWISAGAEHSAVLQFKKEK